MLTPPLAMVLRDSSLGGGQEVQALSGLLFPAYVTLPRRSEASEKSSKQRALSALPKSATSERPQARLRRWAAFEGDAGRARKASDFLAFLGVDEHRRKGVEWADKPRSRCNGMNADCTKVNEIAGITATPENAP
jgi:hypothetical protein